MNTRQIITAALFGWVSTAGAEVEITMAKLRDIGLLPQDKAELRPEDKLDMKRRNPFAERKKAAPNKPVEQVETEESKLRAFFDKEKVNGIMKFGDKHIVSLGRLSLEEGQIIRPIIPNQTQILRVIKVTDAELEIGWVEDATIGLEPVVPRKIQKKINLRPEVRALVAGADEAGEKAAMYVMDDKGTVVVPHKNVFPNPSDILDSIPPGSDTNPESVLNEQERQSLNNALQASQNGNPPSIPKPDIDPSSAVPSEAPPAPPLEDPEDAVQPDPDLVEPPSGNQPAGQPGRR